MGSAITAVNALISLGSIMSWPLDLLTLTSLSNFSTCTELVQWKSKEKWRVDVPIILMNGINTSLKDDFRSPLYSHCHLSVQYCFAAWINRLLKSSATALFSVMTILFSPRIISIACFVLPWRNGQYTFQNSHGFLDNVDFFKKRSFIPFLHSEVHLLRWILTCAAKVLMFPQKYIYIGRN